jgi:acyl carrier protein
MGRSQPGANNATHPWTARTDWWHCMPGALPRMRGEGDFRQMALRHATGRSPQNREQREIPLDTQVEVQRVLDEVLSLRGRAMTFDADTPLLGAIPELDSMAVVTLITTLEDRFGISVDDDEISGDTFATLGSLTSFVSGKL